MAVKRIALQTLYLALCVGFMILLALMVYQNFMVRSAFYFTSLYISGGTLGPYFLMAGVFGALASFFGLSVWLTQINHRLKHFEHQKEKAQVTAESSSDLVQALENKVATLEKALEKALKQGGSETSEPAVKQDEPVATSSI